MAQIYEWFKLCQVAYFTDSACVRRLRLTSWDLSRTGSCRCKYFSNNRFSINFWRGKCEIEASFTYCFFGTCKCHVSFLKDGSFGAKSSPMFSFAATLPAAVCLEPRRHNYEVNGHWKLQKRWAWVVMLMRLALWFVFRRDYRLTRQD